MHSFRSLIHSVFSSSVEAQSQRPGGLTTTWQGNRSVYNGGEEEVKIRYLKTVLLVAFVGGVDQLATFQRDLFDILEGGGAGPLLEGLLLHGVGHVALDQKVGEEEEPPRFALALGVDFDQGALPDEASLRVHQILMNKPS